LTAPAASAAGSATTAKTAASTGTGRLRPRFVHRQRPAAKLVTVQLCDGLLCILVAGHLDKRKPAGATGHTVTHH
jgi:hypothetical protein